MAVWACCDALGLVAASIFLHWRTEFFGDKSTFSCFILCPFARKKKKPACFFSSWPDVDPGRPHRGFYHACVLSGIFKCLSSLPWKVLLQPTEPESIRIWAIMVVSSHMMLPTIMPQAHMYCSRLFSVPWEMLAAIPYTAPHKSTASPPAYTLRKKLNLRNILCTLPELISVTKTILTPKPILAKQYSNSTVSWRWQNVHRGLQYEKFKP